METVPGRSVHHYVFDLTTTARSGGRVTGMVRTELALARALEARLGEAFTAVVHSTARDDFFVVPRGLRTVEAIRGFLLLLDGDQGFPGAPYRRKGGAPAILLLCGSTMPERAEFADALLQFAGRIDAAVGFLVHDMIPRLFPYWYPSGFKEQFCATIAKLTRHAAIVFCNSENTRRDVERFLADEGIVPPPTLTLRLGDELDPGLTPGEQRSRAPLPVGGPPYALAVGAIHPRKNYELLFKTWKRLARSQDTLRLVIAGGWPSQGRETARMFLEDDEVGPHVSILSDVGDGELEQLYRNAAFTLYPSLYEGWGLPVAESFALGKLCIASDRASIPEILDGYAEYLPPDDVDLWEARIRFYARSPAARTETEHWISSHYQPQGWDACAARIIDDIDGAGLRPIDPPRLRIGDYIDFADAAAPMLVGSGWSRSADGGWHGAGDARCLLDIEPPPAGEPCALILELSATGSVPVRVSIGQETPSEFIVEGTRRRFVVLAEPARMAEGRQELAFSSATRGDFGLMGIEWNTLERIVARTVVEVDGRDHLALADFRNAAWLRGDWIGVSADEATAIAFYPESACTAHIQLVADADAGGEIPCTITLMVNGALAEAFSATTGTILRRTLAVPLGTLARYGSATIRAFAISTGQEPHSIPVAIVETLVEGCPMLLPALPPRPPQLLASLTPSREVKFGKDSAPESLDLLGFGWAALEGYGVQASGAFADLTFAMTEQIEAPIVQMTGKCRSLDGGARAITIAQDGEVVGRAELSGDSLERFSLSLRPFEGPSTTLRFTVVEWRRGDQFVLRSIRLGPPEG